MMKPLIITMLGFLSLSALFFNSTYAQSQNEGGKPNVILIYTDDQGTLDMNIYGAKDLYTPHMDGLAEKGVRFTQFYAAAPVCSPSRSALMTGRYPQRAGLATNASSKKGEGAGMPGSQVTMAEVFKSAGYATGHIGKWHLGYSASMTPNAQGFDYSFGHMGGCIDNYSHFFYWDGPNRHDLWRNGEEVWDDGAFFPDLTVEEVNQFMTKNKDNPFYLYWALNIPHYPLQGEQKWRDHYKDLPSPRKEYAALISTMDEKIGLVLQKLKELGLDDNTIVVFQSDHGHSEEERSFGGGGFAGPYKGAKFSLFEGGIRVPAIISWPGSLPQNEVRDQMAVNVDWFPTLMDLCGIPQAGHKIDGKSLMEVIQSSKADSPHETFFWQTGGAGGPQWAVRHGDWKLIHNPSRSHLDENEIHQSNTYLFDIKSDHEESKNKIDTHSELANTLQEKYLEWIKEVENQ